MIELANKYLPNVMDKIPEFMTSIYQTLYMTFVSGAVALVLGLFIGVALTVTCRGGILPSPIFWYIIDKVVNFIRSIPFIILLTLVFPLSRIITGTAIGPTGALVPLVFGTAPFFSRQVELALAEIDKGLLEAAHAMGTSPIGIIFRVYLKESIPSLLRAVTITFISLVGLTAMAGAIGGGGLGDFAIRYGYNRFQTDVTIVTVLVLVLFVTVIQSLGNFIIKKVKH